MPHHLVYSEDYFAGAVDTTDSCGNFLFRSLPVGDYWVNFERESYCPHTDMIMMYHRDSVAYRWKGQICENSKMLCFNNLFPEFNHNELVGWEILSGMQDKMVVIILKDHQDHPQIKKRMEIVEGMIRKKGVRVIEAESEGENLLSRIFSLIQLGDFISFYLAILNNVDPTPVKLIDCLKKKLAK